MSDTTAKLKDSGARQQFDTGAVRDTQTLKGRFDLLPFDGLLRIAQIFELGAIKYEDRNWEKGIPVSRSINSGIRHLLKAANGHTDENHLALAGANVLFALATIERASRGVLPPDMNDLPSHLDDYNPSDLEGELPSYSGQGLRVSPGEIEDSVREIVALTEDDIPVRDEDDDPEIVSMPREDTRWSDLKKDLTAICGTCDATSTYRDKPGTWYQGVDSLRQALCDEVRNDTGYWAWAEWTEDGEPSPDSGLPGMPEGHSRCFITDEINYPDETTEETGDDE